MVAVQIQSIGTALAHEGCARGVMFRHGRSSTQTLPAHTGRKLSLGSWLLRRGTLRLIDVDGYSRPGLAGVMRQIDKSNVT